MAKVYAPVKGYTGTSASIEFVDGVGETSDANLLTWFVAHGYVVDSAPVKKRTVRRKKSDSK
jgi:hypothetical protein